MRRRSQVSNVRPGRETLPPRVPRELLAGHPRGRVHLHLPRRGQRRLRLGELGALPLRVQYDEVALPVSLLW